MFIKAWEVLVLFLIPIGGGIPAGVVLAQKYGFSWIVMCGLYLISDMILACVFEPMLIAFLILSEKNAGFAKVRRGLAQSSAGLIRKFSIHPSPFALIMLTFGSDPMTGRSIAKMFGHGFWSGWLFVIIGDMLFFAILMISTLVLKNILGDGTWAALLITVAVLVTPGLIRRFKTKRPSETLE